MRAKSSEDNEDIQTKARVIEAEFTDEELAKEQSSQAQKNSSSGSSSSSSSSETIGTETAGDFIRKQIGTSSSTAQWIRRTREENI